MTQEQLWKLELGVRGRKPTMGFLDAKRATLDELVAEADARLSELVDKSRHGVTPGDLMVATAELVLLLAALRGEH